MGLFCRHNWEVVTTYENKIYEFDTDVRPCKVTRVYIMRCTKCGKLKKKKFVITNE